MNIKAICFDLDGVYFTSEGKNSFHQALISEYGATKEVADNLMYRSPEMALLVRGKMTGAEFWNHVREAIGSTATDDALTSRWIRDYRVNQEVKQVVLSAKAQGYKTCVCTNNNGIRLPALEEKFHFMSDFDVVVSSHEVGHAKPDKEIYEALIHRLGVQPNELIYSDDNPARLTGARELGIETFVYENFVQFLGELGKRGVLLERSKVHL